jgi:CheY-like chemotaxis protein
MVSDQGRVAQVLTNILGNAIKFTESGEVRLAVIARPREQGSWEWIFRVSDTGPGVSEEARERIFEPFFQEDSSASRVHGGAGLGLAISRNIAKLLDGSLKVSRIEGGGSEFSLIIHAPADAEREPVVSAPVRPGSLDGCHVLVVEDNLVNRKLCHAMLTRLGCDVTFAEDGLQMIEIFAPETYDVMLVDIQLPHMDGCQATERVREIERERGCLRTPIVAMTANVLNEDRNRCMQAGMDDFLTKPLSQANLRSAVAKWAKVG